MKKLLIAAALASTLASSAFAMENAFYVSGHLGGSMLKEQSQNGVKYKGSNHLVGGLGVGTYLMDNVRTEVVFSNHFSADQKAKKDTKNKLEFDVMSVSLRGLVDVADMGYAKAFVGAGVGMSSVKAKVKSSGSSVSTKKANNVSYLVTAGVSTEVADGVMADLAYSFNDHGETKKVKGTNNKYRFKSHDVTAGLRVEL